MTGQNTRIAWTANLQNNPEAKKDFEETLVHSTQVLKRLKDILEEREAGLDKIDYSLSTFDNPSWSHKQANILGRRAELEWIKQLLT